MTCLARVVDALTYTAAALVLGGLVAAMAGAAMENVLFDVGMWMQIAAVPVLIGGAILTVVDYRRLRGDSAC